HADPHLPAPPPTRRPGEPPPLRRPAVGHAVEQERVAPLVNLALAGEDEVVQQRLSLLGHGQYPGGGPNSATRRMDSGGTTWPRMVTVPRTSSHDFGSRRPERTPSSALVAMSPINATNRATDWQPASRRWWMSQASARSCQRYACEARCHAPGARLFLPSF